MNNKIIKNCPQIITLCGSTRFGPFFDEVNKIFTLEGYIVLTIGVPKEKVDISSTQKSALDELHKRKIDIADKVFIVNVDGYIGESTRNEIDYAKSQNKPIEYLVKK